MIITVQVRNEGSEVDFTDIKPILGLNDTYVNRNSSNCDRLQIDGIPIEDGAGGKFSLAFDINVS